MLQRTLKEDTSTPHAGKETSIQMQTWFFVFCEKSEVRSCSVEETSQLCLGTLRRGLICFVSGLTVFFTSFTFNFSQPKNTN